MCMVTKVTRRLYSELRATWHDLLMAVLSTEWLPFSSVGVSVERERPKFKSQFLLSPAGPLWETRSASESQISLCLLVKQEHCPSCKPESGLALLAVGSHGSCGSRVRVSVSFHMSHRMELGTCLCCWAVTSIMAGNHLSLAYSRSLCIFPRSGQPQWGVYWWLVRPAET